MISQSLLTINSPHNTLQTHNLKKIMNRASFIQKSRMQALSVLLLPQTFPDSKDFSPISTKSNQDFSSKLKTDHEEEKFEEEQEFSFACANPQGSLIDTDEIFDNGQIRPTSLVFYQSLLFADAHNRVALPLWPPLKKLFIEHSNCTSSIGEPHCEWSQKKTMLELEVETSNDSYKKSKSMRFSKLWRFRRDLKLRSNKNDKDTFVFLNPLVQVPAKPRRFDEEKEKNTIIKKTKGGKRKTKFLTYEKHYVMNRMRMESDKRRSFLPYRQELVGLFANMNRFSKNIHPF